MLAAAARAEDAPRRVGSLNYISGEVSYLLRAEAGEPNGSDEVNWLQADFDQPVCQDMSLRTGAMARARVRIGPDAIQMSDDTWLNVINLTDQLIEASVRYGRIYLQLGKLDPGESVEIETPRGSLWLLQPGAYDVETGTGDQPTRIVVFEGKARFVGGAADLPIAAGKAVQITGSYPEVAAAESDWTGINPAQPATTVQPVSPTGNVSAEAPSSPTSAFATPPAQGSPNRIAARQTATAPPNPGPPAGASRSPVPSDATALAATDDGSPPAARARAPPDKPYTATVDSGQKSSDEFLLWVEESGQDQQQQIARQSTRYVSAETTGADALDRYGRWDTLPDTGPVWFPTSVPGDWAPYRFGHWDWIEPWGWTWVDDQPWGFAPFHYGRWANIDGRWGWVPGAVQAHPVYAPALVAFVDTPDAPAGGPEGGPDVGWFPLGPGDDYAPWYQAGADYVVSVNAPEHGHFRDLGLHGYGDRGREAWRGEYFNRRFATVVSREAFADARRIDRATMRRMEPSRLEHAAVMRGAPRIMPAAMRRSMGPAEFRGEPRGATPAAMAGAMRARPDGGAGREPGVAARGGPAAAERPREQSGERAPQSFEGSEAGHGVLGNRGVAAQSGRVETARGTPQSAIGATRPAGRPQVFQSSAQGFRGGAPQQFGRPDSAPGFRGAASPQFARPQVASGFRGGASPVGQPQVAQGFRGSAPQQFGRPQAFQAPAAANRGGGMMGRPAPQVAQGFRGGAQQFARPQAFQAPAAANRGAGMMGRPAPQVAARPIAHPVAASGGGGGRHK
jgi:hypothetical protein